MEIEGIGVTETEQCWIQKYRAALDAPSRPESWLRAAGVALRRVAKAVGSIFRSQLKKSARPAAASKQSAKVTIVSGPINPDRKQLVVKSKADRHRMIRKQPPPQRRSRRKAS